MQKSVSLLPWVFLVMQVTPPVPMRAASQSANQEEKTGQGHQTSPKKPLPVKPAPQIQNGTERVRTEDKQQGETLTRITAMPQVSVADKRRSVLDYVFDWGPWIFSFALVIIGYFGIRYAKRTLDTIKRQADIMDTQVADARKSGEEAATVAKGTLTAIQEQAALMKQQVSTAERNATAAQVAADAAKTSAKIVMDTQRAFVQVSSIGFNRGNIHLPNNEPVAGDVSVTINFKNSGPTRAVNVAVKGTLKTSSKSTSLAPPISYDLPALSEVAIAFDAFNKWLDADAIALLRQGSAILQASIKITYADVFGGSHEIEIEATLRDWIRRGWESSKIKSS